MAPLSVPWFSMAVMAYAEHVGSNLHEAGSAGEIHLR